MLSPELKVLILDFETYDFNLLKFGAGWAFKINYKTYPFEVLCVGLKKSDGTSECIDFIEDYKKGKEALLSVLNNHDVIVCHNAMYDIGILYYLFPEEMSCKRWMFIDTVLLARMVDQNIDSKLFTKTPYSLDTLTRYWKLDEVKETSILTDYIWNSGMYAQVVKETTGVNKKTRPSEKVLTSFAYLHLKELPKEIRESYCMQDIFATDKLFIHLHNKLGVDFTEEQYTRYSKLIWICVEAKTRGTDVDLDRTKQLIKEFSVIREETNQKILEHIIDKLGLEYLDININSTKQLGEVFVKLGYRVLVTAAGNPSITKDWLNEQPITDELCAALITYRKTYKMTKDFLQKTLDYQEAIPSEYRDPHRGKLFPSLKVLGAFKTGRFTSGGGSGCKELSIHQIPRRDEEFGKPIREIFIPYENETMVCGDFNGQESRLQVHYGSLLGCRGVDGIIERWWKEPEMKFYTMVSEQTGLNYDDAKMITLGLSYDMHNKKLCLRLGLAETEGMKIITQYHEMLPFIKQLQEITAASIIKNGYIKTMASRKLYIDCSYKFKGRLVTKERKALSKLIQGSAADQCMEAMIRAYDAGLKILFSVHDEILISSPAPEVDLLGLKHCMESAYSLKVPVIADCDVGKSWGEAK